MRFLWDEAKNQANRRKHGLSFEKASRVFTGGNEYLEVFDEAHSGDEDRFIAIGSVQDGVILVVYVEPAEETIRIISARTATRRERRMFFEYMKGIHP